jgi:sodium-dependent phosphate cotransporter
MRQVTEPTPIESLPPSSEKDATPYGANSPESPREVLNGAAQEHPVWHLMRQGGQWLSIVALVYVLVVAVGLVGDGFETVTGERARALFTLATNPFLGLIVGTVATALIQSSSTVTSIIVGLVAGGLPVATAIPMVMGANIGTTLTNTLVSLGHVSNQQEFKKAFAAATVHDAFNLLSVALFLPLEIFFHPLEKICQVLAIALVEGESAPIGEVNVLKTATTPVIDAAKNVTQDLSTLPRGMVLIGVGIGLIMVTITLMGKLLKVLMVGRAKEIVYSAMGRGSVVGIITGCLITVVVQSSSTTTSLVVPLAGTGVFTLAQIYPFTLGANIGTCLTAVLAASVISGTQAVPAMEIAMVHLVFNTVSVVVIYCTPFLRPLPMLGAETLAAIASQRKAWAFVYVLGVFFLIPGLLLGLTAWPHS